MPELFDRATEQLAGGDPGGAARELDRIYRLDPDGRLAVEVLFRAGVAHDHAGRLDAARRRFEEVARRFPESPLARNALVRAIRIGAYVEQYERVGKLAEVLMARYQDLRPFESIVAHSAKALALVSAGDTRGAERHVAKGLRTVEANRLDTAGRVPRDLAQLYFAQAEIRRIQGERLTFRPVPRDFAQVLERRCQLLLDAQRAYSDTMRAYDAHWSAMAGYRVGELYQRLHSDLMSIPVPVGADTPRRRRLFEGAMRLRYSILLTKGLAMMEHTLSMARRTGEASAWVRRAEDGKRRIERAIGQERAALDRLPFSRAQLAEALEGLKRSAR